MASSIAQHEPLPLVPPTVMIANAGIERQRLRHARDALEAHRDGLRVQLLQVSQPLRERALRSFVHGAMADR